MSNSGIGQFIPLILIFVIFYFFLIRPQQKKVKEHKIMVENLKRGDKVITVGGIVGTIDRIIDAEKVEVEIADNVKVEIIKSTGIQSLVTANQETKNNSKFLKSALFFKIKNFYYTNSFIIFSFFHFIKLY
jgi:preprotein translocase subunit YajC